MKTKQKVILMRSVSAFVIAGLLSQAQTPLVFAKTHTTFKNRNHFLIDNAQTPQQFKDSDQKTSYRLLSKKWQAQLLESQNAQPRKLASAGSPIALPPPELQAINTPLPTFNFASDAQSLISLNTPAGVYTPAGGLFTIKTNTSTYTTWYLGEGYVTPFKSDQYLVYPSGQIRLASTSYYDKTGRIVQQVSRDFDGKIQQVVNYYYDSATSGQYSRSLTINDKGQATHATGYDANGRVVYIDQNPIAGYFTKRTYYDKDNKASQVVDFNAIGQMAQISLSDADKTVLSIVYTSAQSYDVSKITITYNKPELAGKKSEFDFKTGVAKDFLGSTVSKTYTFRSATWSVAGSSRSNLGRISEWSLYRNNKPVYFEISKSSETLLKEYKAYTDAFTSNANTTTGFTLSHRGDSLNPYSSFTYDMALLIMEDFGPNSQKLLNSYTLNFSGNASQAKPQTMAGSTDPRTPKGGVLSDIRILNFTGTWWNNWDWSSSSGPNAWIGMAALQSYARDNTKTAYLNFAKERATFLLAMEDTKDGGLRYGPNKMPDDFYWNIKSTENNESALYFFDMLYQATSDIKYKNAGDRIYAYLKKLYDPTEHAFARGEVFDGAQWHKDTIEDFAPDTANWAPMERMIEDPFFGATKAARLSEVEKVLDTAKEKTGVFVASAKGPQFTGISFSETTKNLAKPGSPSKKGVISIEWSSQYAVRRLKISQEWAKLGNTVNANNNYLDYKNLTTSLGNFFTQKDGGMLAPYAVYVDGTVAKAIDTTHGWFTPNGYGSVASTYYTFAVSGFDPLVLN